MGFLIRLAGSSIYIYQHLDLFSAHWGAYSTLLCKWHPLNVYVWAATLDPNARALANMIDFIVQ